MKRNREVNGLEQTYRVLLADDEEEIRAGISRKIQWDRLGFGLAGEAGNGREALELAEQLRPDVVLTDIKMPFMDGLELCRHLQKRPSSGKGNYVFRIRRIRVCPAGCGHECF